MSMSSTEISEAEVRIIRWGERVLTPLLIAGFIGVVTYLAGVGNTMAQLTAEHDKYNATNGDLKAAVTKLNDKVEEQLEGQHALEVTVKRIETTQGHYKSQIEDIKRQNTEILRLIRASNQ